jgi:hypothetical protein
MSKLIATFIKNNEFEETGVSGGVAEDGRLKSIKVTSKKTN